MRLCNRKCVCSETPERSPPHTYIFLLALMTVAASPLPSLAPSFMSVALASAEGIAGSAFGMWLEGLSVLKEVQFPSPVVSISSYLSVVKVVVVAVFVRQTFVPCCSS